MDSPSSLPSADAPSLAELRRTLAKIDPAHRLPETPDDLLHRAAELLRANANRLETMNEVNRALNATLDADRVLELILQKAVEIIRAEAGSIFLVDDEADTLIFSVALGPSGIQLVGKQMPIDEKSIAGTTVIRRECLIVNNAPEDPRWNTAFDAETEFKTRDILTVPLVAFDSVVGVIEVINKKDGLQFTADDEAVLTMFARQAAIALVNAQRFTQIDRMLANRVRELSTLELVDRDLNAELDLPQVLRLTLSGAMDFLGAPVGLIALVNPEKTGLHFAEMVGVAQKYHRYQTDALWKLGDGIIGEVAQSGVSRINQDSAIDNFSSDGRSRAQLCVPFLRKDAVIGVLSLESDNPQAFSADDLTFAVRYASHAVLAIQNAQLFAAVKAANDAKSEFMNMTSHELKIPMTSIKGYTKLLAMVGKDTLSEQQLQFVQVINDNVDRMNHLVMELLDVSRIEAGRLRLAMENVSLAEVVRQVVQSVRTQIEEKHLQVQVSVPAELPPVWADHFRLVQVMTNLVSNAYKYTPDGGSIEIAAKTMDGGKRVSVWVKDTGYGISEEDQARLFEKFFRAGDQNIRDVPGTGLGLNITRSLIQLHGGEMWFTSKLGEGSTFGFNLPVHVTQ